MNLITTLTRWIEKHEPIWEYNRLGIAAAGIFIQVTFAAIMIATLGLAGGSLLVGGLGMLLAFIANSLAFGQVPMRWLLGVFLSSIVVNIAIIIFYVLQLL
jgi:hypothetical protein